MCKSNQKGRTHVLIGNSLLFPSRSLRHRHPEAACRVTVIFLVNTLRI